MFSQADLDTVLYGYVITPHHVTGSGDVIGYALTGLVVDFSLSHGNYLGRIVMLLSAQLVKSL